MKKTTALIINLKCEDILFALFDESVRKIEPVFLNFNREAQALNDLSLNLSISENTDFLRRTQMALMMMKDFEQDLQVKQKFFLHLKKKVFISQKLKVNQSMTYLFVVIDKIFDGKVINV